MALRDILLRFDNTVLDGPWRDTVIDLARTQDAHLTGLFVLQAPNLPSFATVEIPVDVIVNYELGERESAQAAKRSFLAPGEQAGLSFEWREAIHRGSGDPAEQLGRSADLVVLGMPANPDLAKEIAATAGRLTLTLGGVLLILPWGAHRPRWVGARSSPGMPAVRRAGPCAMCCPCSLKLSAPWYSPSTRPMPSQCPVSRFALIWRATGLRPRPATPRRTTSTQARHC
jgi:hypothetical protein